MSEKENAVNAIESTRQAQQQAKTDTSWYPKACLALGLLVIPGGLVVPWGEPARYFIFAVVFIALGFTSWVMARKRVAPQGGAVALGLALATWFVLNTLVGALGEGIQSVTLGIFLSTISSVPFFAVSAMYLLKGRSEP